MNYASSYPFVKTDYNAAHLKVLSNISPFAGPMAILSLLCLALPCFFTIYNATPNVPPNRDIHAMITRLAEVFDSTEEYRRLLSCKGPTAQTFLDFFMLLLGNTSNLKLSSSFETNVIVAAQRLADKSGLSPTCYRLDSVTRFADLEAEGGIADIYRGSFRGKSVCVKTVRLKNVHGEPELLWKDLLKEGILWGHLKHPNILPFYGVYRDQFKLSFIAPWMENGDLVTYLKQHKDSNRVMLAYNVAQGLQFLHKKSIVHGDLKGMNVLINDRGQACISDFGFSSILNTEILTWTSQPRPVSMGGTVRWQAPEIFEVRLQAEDSVVICNTKETDIYAFGGLVYEVFVGEVPFSRISNTRAIEYRVMQGQRPTRPADSSLSWNVWGLTEDIWSMMEACWDAKPQRRPTIDDVIERLKLALPQGVEEMNSGSLQPPGAFRETLHPSQTEINMSIEFLESVVASDYLIQTHPF